jgi:hypothetical protein
MKLFVDAWDPAYGTGMEQVDEGPAATSNTSLDTDVETPAASWQPLAPPADVRAPDVVLLVDGVRRNDARIWVEDDGGLTHPGLAASYAAGVVRCDLGRGVAEVVARRVERGLFTPAPGASSLGTPPARYVAHAVAGSEPKHLDAGVGKQLAALEVAVSREVRESTVDEDDLLVADGPLRERRGLPRAIGYIKTHHRRYLSAELTNVVSALPAGSRSPVFRLGDRFSWYLRLPGPPGSAWSGVVRVECSGDLTPQEAIRLADRAAVTLPRFASNAYKDPRAPQNLVPIAGLERRLRGLLGDARLLHRTLLRETATR